MADDVLMTQGDNVLASNGDYEKTHTVEGMMFRCHQAHYGQWPAGEAFGEKMGRNYRHRQRWSPTDKAEFLADCVQAQKPLEEAGFIRNITVEELPSTRGDAPRIRVMAWDVIGQQSVQVTPRAPWGS